MSEHVELNLSGMTCHACAELIQDELRETEGVMQAKVDFERRRATVDFDPARTSPEALIRRVSALGYQAALS